MGEAGVGLAHCCLTLRAPSGLALTPPMGFANWNGFGCNYNDTTFRQQADFLVSSGMAAAVQSPSSQTSPPLPRPGPHASPVQLARC